MPSSITLEPAPVELVTTSRRAFTLKELNLICWALFIAFLVVPAAAVFKKDIQSNWGVLGEDRDFVFFYAMGKMLNEHPPSQLYDYDLQRKVEKEVHPLKDGKDYTPNPYHPYIAILFRPFARLSYSAAYLLWRFISLCLYIAGLALVTRRFFPRDAVRRSLTFCLALSFLPFLWIMIGGQIPTIGFIGLALAFREEDRRRPFLSGLALALCLYKPTLLVLIVPMLLVSKRYKTLTGLLAGGVSLAMFATALEGVGIWPGYIRLLLSFGSAAAQTHGYRVLRYYMDLFAFSSLLPGGRSWLGIGIVAACGCCALVALFSAWRKNAGAQGPAGILLWATTVTWTLVLNLYSPVYDSIIVVISVIATAAVLKALPEPRLRRQFTGIWVVGLIASWVTIQIAQGTGFQLFTVLFALFGALQLTALRKLQQSQLQKMDASEPVMASSATGVRSFPEAALACSGATYVR